MPDTQRNPLSAAEEIAALKKQMHAMQEEIDFLRQNIKLLLLHQDAAMSSINYLMEKLPD